MLFQVHGENEISGLQVPLAPSIAEFNQGPTTRSVTKAFIPSARKIEHADSPHQNSHSENHETRIDSAQLANLLRVNGRVDDNQSGISRQLSPAIPVSEGFVSPPNPVKDGVGLPNIPNGRGRDDADESESGGTKTQRIPRVSSGERGSDIERPSAPLVSRTVPLNRPNLNTSGEDDKSNTNDGQLPIVPRFSGGNGEESNGSPAVPTVDRKELPSLPKINGRGKDDQSRISSFQVPKVAPAIPVPGGLVSPPIPAGAGDGLPNISKRRDRDGADESGNHKTQTARNPRLAGGKSGSNTESPSVPLVSRTVPLDRPNLNNRGEGDKSNSDNAQLPIVPRFPGGNREESFGTLPKFSRRGDDDHSGNSRFQAPSRSSSTPFAGGLFSPPIRATGKSALPNISNQPKNLVGIISPSAPSSIPLPAVPTVFFNPPIPSLTKRIPLIPMVGK